MTPAVSIVVLVVEVTLSLGVIVLILLRRNVDPVSRLTWITVVVLLPVVGIVAYVLIGEVRLGRQRVLRQQELVAKQMAETEPRWDPGRASPPEIDPRFRQIADLAVSVGGTYPRGGNGVVLLGDSDLTIQSLVEAIDAAERSCHLLFYIYLTDFSGQRVAEALMRAAGRGVACRVLVDAVGSKDFLRSDLRRGLERHGVRVVAALPVNPLRALFARLDLRNHRKIAVVDGRVAFTGSQNIADAEFAPKRRFAPWVDATLRIAGPTASDLQRVFVEDWYLDTHEWLGECLRETPPPEADGVVAQAIATGPGSYNRAMRQVQQAVVHVAREEIILTSPYFVPDEATIAALETAARRGVATRLVLPARNDSPLVAAASRSYYEPLLSAGVEIHEFQRGLLHSKTITIDRDLALVSSANLDRRSFDLNFEVSIIVYDDDFASQLRFLQMAYITDSRPIEPERWSRRAWPRRLFQNAMGMMSPLL